MNEDEQTGQTLIELLILLLPIVISIVLSRVFFSYFGWWVCCPRWFSDSGSRDNFIRAC